MSVCKLCGKTVDYKLWCLYDALDCFHRSAPCVGVCKECYGKARDDKTYEKSVDVHKTEAGELLDVSIGSKEISAFELDILEFLKKEGKI